MSRYILTASVLEFDDGDCDKCPPFDALNASLEGQFKRADHRYEKGRAVADLFAIAQLNHVGPDVVAGVMRKSAWKWPDEVRLMVNDEATYDDFRFVDWRAA